MAAEQGEAQAVNDIGNMYEDGQGVEQSYEKAKEYYQQAISMGSAYGLISMGYMYELGHGVEQSYEKAAEYYQQAADAGLQEAADALEKLKADGLIPEESEV